MYTSSLNSRPYKIRKTWEDTKTQKSSFSNLQNAIKKMNEVNAEIDDPKEWYKIWKYGKVFLDPTKYATETPKCCKLAVDNNPSPTNVETDNGAQFTPLENIIAVPVIDNKLPWYKRFINWIRGIFK